MALNPRIVAELMRQRFGLPDNSQASRFINLIPQALKAFGRKVAVDPYLRPLLTTDKSTAIIAITSGGKVDLTTAFSSWQILLEFIDLGQVYLNAVAYPMQKLGSPQLATLPNYLTSVFTYYYLQGNTMFVLPSTTTGSVAFAVPCYPTTLAALPASAETEELFLQELTNIAGSPVDSEK